MRVNLQRARIYRSQNLPLDVEVNDRIVLHPLYPSRSLSITGLHSRLASVLPLIRSWRSFSISIHGYYPYLWNTLLSKLCTGASSRSSSSRVPCLRKLSLVYPANDDVKEFLLFGGEARQLEELTLHGIRLRWTPGLFANLVKLDLIHQVMTPRADAVREVLDMLSISTRLRSLTIAFQRPHSAVSPQWSPVLSPMTLAVTLPHLQSLHLRALPGPLCRELTLFVTKLDLPSLAVIRLSDANDAAYRMSRRELASLIRPFRFHARIKEVVVDDGFFHPRIVWGFTQSLPSFKRVSIHSRT